MGITEIVLQIPKATTLLLFTLPFCILLTAAGKECGCFQEKKGKKGKKEREGKKKKMRRTQKQNAKKKERGKIKEGGKERSWTERRNKEKKQEGENECKKDVIQCE